MRISDWSSDVCSSDLHIVVGAGEIAVEEGAANAEPLGEFCRDPEVGTAFTLACDHSGAELNQALRFLPDLEADPQAFALPSRVDRKQIVGGVGGRVGEEIAVDLEVEPLQRLPATLWLGARHQGVGAEGDERANAVRLAFENGAIEIAGRDPAPCRRAEWTLCETQGFLPLLRRKEAGVVDRVGLRGRPGDVAARGIDLALEGEEGRDRAVNLRRVGMLAGAGPAGVAGTSRRGEHLREARDRKSTR